MTAPVPENADTRSAATDHGPLTTDSARSAANRRNARKSTGPRTPEGKAKSALNALKHGLTAHAPLLSSEDPTEYNLFAQAYIEELNPQTIEQFSHAKQIILVTWKLNRIPLLESKTLDEQANHHPLMEEWRQECAQIEEDGGDDEDLPDEPELPDRITEDLVAESFFPPAPLPATIDFNGNKHFPRRPATTPLQRFRQYHSTLLRQLSRFRNEYRQMQNEPIPDPESDTDSAPADPAPNPLEPDPEIPTPASEIPTPQSQISDLRSEIPTPKSEISNLKSQISNPPASAPLAPMPQNEPNRAHVGSASADADTSAKRTHFPAPQHSPRPQLRTTTY